MLFPVKEIKKFNPLPLTTNSVQSTVTVLVDLHCTRKQKFTLLMSLGCDWQISMHFPRFFFSGLLVVVVMIAKRNIVIKGSGVIERHSKVYFKVPTNTYLT